MEGVGEGEWEDKEIKGRDLILSITTFANICDWKIDDYIFLQQEEFILVDLILMSNTFSEIKYSSYRIEMARFNASMIEQISALFSRESFHLITGRRLLLIFALHPLRTPTVVPSIM